MISVLNPQGLNVREVSSVRTTAHVDVSPPTSKHALIAIAVVG